MIDEILKIMKDALGKDAKARLFLEVPLNPQFGHYSSNVAMQQAKQEGGNPIELAKEYIEKIKIADKKKIFEKIEVAPPGFINFWIKDEAFQAKVDVILKEKEKYGTNTEGKGKKARIEYVSANPTGPVHVGNARGGPIGETLSRVFEKSGYKVLREYIHNDAGTQIERLSETLQYWYEGGKGEFPEDGYKGEYPKEVVEAAKKKLGSKATKESLLDFGLEYIFQENVETLKRLGITFDLVVKESELISSKKTEEAVEKIKEKGVAKESEGALWFAPKDEFLEDREAVIMRSDGQPTYFASDIAYHKEKFTSGYDKVIDILGSNHHGHVAKLQALASIFHFDISHFTVILYQYVRIKRGGEVTKMAKRAGTYITAKEVIDEVGADSFIFLLLMNAPNTHIDFDLELAKEQSMKNPVYYVQYAYVRTRSILENSKSETLKPEQTQNLKLENLKTESELALIHQLVQWPDIVARALRDYEVHRITRYAMDVAKAFHSFYEKERVLGEDKAIEGARLGLVRATQIILEDVFRVLGVSSPEKM